MLTSLRHNIFDTFRGRLALLYIAVEFSILMFAGLLTYFLLSRQVYSEVDDSLYRQAHALATQLEHARFYHWSFHLNEFAGEFQGTVQLVAANGVVQYASDRSLIGRGGNEVSRALAEAMRRDLEAVYVSTQSLLRKDNMRVIAMPVHRAGQTVAVLLLGRSTSELQGFFKLLFTLGASLGAISMFISAWAGYVMARRAMKPIQEINSAARSVAAGDLTRRLKSRSQEKEFSELVESLNRMFQALESSFLAQKRFTADASHELRIPLTILKGETEVALRQQRTTSDYEHLLHQHLDIIERMQRIVDDLLTLARADAGLLELAQEPVDLSLLLQEVGQHHLILYAERHLQLEMDIQDELEVMGDEGQLERVIFNLLNNAYKYAPENSSVHLVARADDDHALISVRDEGPGIAEEHQTMLFDRFYRADAARAREHGGAGLGLAICKRIVEAHDGEISLKSRPGEGATFLIRLPLSSENPEHSRRLHSLLSTK